MATLGSKDVLSIIKLKENGELVDFYVAGHNYESGLNGNGRTLVVRCRGCGDGSLQWNSTGINNYSGSDIDRWLNNTYAYRLDADIRAAMGTTAFYYTPGNGNKTVGTLRRAVFVLSGTEVGQSAGTSLNKEGTALSQTFRVALGNSPTASTTPYWTRSPAPGNTKAAWAWSVNNRTTYDVKTYGYLCLPAFTLPSTTRVNGDGTVSVNTAPTAPSSLTVPATIHGGSTITLEWTASADAEGNLEGYAVERSLDGGSTWAQIYQGSARTATNAVAFGTESVMYRVRAYDAEGLTSGWKTSGQVTVINNTAPTIPDGLTVPEQVNGNQPLTITWGASTDGENNLSGYSLERQVGGGEWEAVYSGPELTFTDQITKGWQTVAYRVRAYDDASAYSGYAVSEVREVNNNTPPEISCEYPSNTSLGQKNEGFTVPYSVGDEEGDPVTVTEAVDGVTMRTFAVQLGEACSFQLDGAAFMKVLNGAHTLSITAHDGASGATHSLTFSKQVTKATVTLAQPMEADGPISVCVLSVSGSIPADAAYKVEVTNNAKDDAPVWEDCTVAVKAGGNYIFENDTAANGPAFSFRLSVERGESGQGGYIKSVQGGFQ